MLFLECIISILIIRAYCTEQQEAYFNVSRIVWYFRTIFFYRNIQPVALSFNGQTRYALKRRKNVVAYFQVRLSTEESRRRISWKRHDPFNISRRRQHTTLGNRSIRVKNLGENRLSTDSVSFRVTHDQLSRYRRY